MPVCDRSVEVLEASYDLARSDRAWLGRVVRAARDARPVAGMHMGAAGFFFRAAPDRAELRAWDHVLLDVSEDAMTALDGFHASLSPQALNALFLQPAMFATLSQMGVPADPRAVALGIPEVLGLQAMDSSGVGCSLLFALPQQTRLRQRVRAHWQAVALHLRAAVRLRQNLRGADPWHHAEAVIDPAQGNGRVVHAAGAARCSSALEALRRAARSIDRARTRDGQDRGAVIKAWPALVSGQWTLVERFERDGRRYYIALRNEAEAEALVKLTQRERQVLAQAVRGDSSKMIADALGSAESTVNTHLTCAMSKLRMRRRSELPWLDAEVETWHLRVGDSALLVMRTRDDQARLLDGLGLTGAEKAVLAGMLQGLSNNEIAHRRGARPRTVANQVQAIFRKTRVCSRAELCALMARRG